MECQKVMFKKAQTPPHSPTSHTSTTTPQHHNTTNHNHNHNTLHLTHNLTLYLISTPQMNERASLPVSPPVPNPTPSYWHTCLTPPPFSLPPSHRSTPDLPSKCDTVIIGSGISGASIAYNLLLLLNHPPSSQPPRDETILLLEARTLCSGATGRNGGHTKAASYRTFLSHVSSLGLEEAVKIARLEYDNIKAVHLFAQTQGIDCDLFSGDTIDVIYDGVQWAEAQQAVKKMKEVFPEGDPVGRYILLSKEEVERDYYAHDYDYEGKKEEVKGGVRYEAGGLSAYKFVMGLLKLVEGKGVNVQAETAAAGLERDETTGEWVVKTDRGEVRAGRVVMATNGYTAGLMPEVFQGVVVPLRGQITAHRPGSKMPNKGCLGTTYSFIYERGYEYMITRPEGSELEGDIIMGGGLVRGEAEEGLREFGVSDDSGLNQGISEYLRETTARYFGRDWGDDSPEGRIRQEWTGIMGFSPDGFPFVGEVPNYEGLWVSTSFQGHGMVLCWMCADALVKMMRGGTEEGALRKWFPDMFRITEERLKKRFQGRLS
ncbi:putative Glycine/D-amino acid oxidase [Cercophora samala]|uniref:Glycine/D-amino acid oxidase n=1 Tax=Cercophora samala TaxID=330535 RepID=A0AA39ZDG2_9PEZI|nr:putative Glycine/D-amino acid oxidase [Cercophora samala]